MVGILLVAQLAFADRVTLKNGDRITGKIVKKDGEKVTIKTEAAGTIVIKWDAVAGIEADSKLYIELADGSKLVGSISSGTDGVNVTTESGDTSVIARDKIQAIRNESEEKAFQAVIAEKEDSSFFNRWSGSADLGFSLTAGNSDTRSLTFGARGQRVSEKDKIFVYGKGVQASNSNSGTSVTTAQAFWFGARYDRDLNKKTFVFAKADFAYDKPQELNLRAVFGGGFGYHWIKSDRTKFDVFGGATYNREYYDNADNRSSAEALVGEEFDFKFTERTGIEQRLEVYPNLTRPGSVRATLDSSFVTKLNNWLDWHVSFGDRYDSDPVPGTVQNDVLLSTGIRASFGKKKGN